MLTEYSGPLASFFSSITWAVGVTMYTRLSRKYPGTAINFCRALVAFLMFLVATFFFESASFSEALSRYAQVPAKQALWLAASVFSSYAFGDVLFMLSATKLGVPAALAIASTYPLWSALGGLFFRGESLTPTLIIGLILVVSGTITVIWSGRHAQEISEEQKKLPLKKYIQAVILAFTASLFWAMNAVGAAQGGVGIPLALANSIRLGSAVILCPLTGFFFARIIERKKGPVVYTMSLSDFFKSIWVFAFEGFGGALAFVYGLTHAPLAIASALSSLAPVLSVPVTVALGYEPFCWKRSAGVLQVVAGVCLLLIKST